MGFWAYVSCLLSLLGLGVAWARALIFLLSPYFSSLRLWASKLSILPYHFIVLAITLLRVTLWTCGVTFLLCQLTSLSIFYLRLPRSTFHIFTSFGLCWPTFLLCQPISLFHFSGFLNPFTFSLPFLLLWLFIRSFGLLGPITTFLPLITSWAYWSLGRPIEFTNSFLRLPWLIYVFFTSFHFDGLTTLFFGLPRLVYFFFTSFFNCCGLASHQSWHFSLLGSFPYSFTIFPFSPSLYCWTSSSIRPFVKSGHQHFESRKWNQKCIQQISEQINLYNLERVMLRTQIISTF